MSLTPYRRGGTDVPLTDGGTGASTAGAALTALGGLDTTAHNALDHTGLTGIGAGLMLQRVIAVFAGNTSVTNLAPSTPPTISQGVLVGSGTITPTSASSRIRVRAGISGRHSGAVAGIVKFWINKTGTTNSFHSMRIFESPTGEVTTDFVAGSTAVQTWQLRTSLEGPLAVFNVNIDSSFSSWMELTEIT